MLYPTPASVCVPHAIGVAQAAEGKLTQQQLEAKTEAAEMKLQLALLRADEARHESWDNIIAVLGHNSTALQDMEKRLTDKITDSTRQLFDMISDESAAIKTLMLDLQNVTAPYLFEVVPIAPGAGEIAGAFVAVQGCGGESGAGTLGERARRGRGLLQRAKSAAKDLAKAGNDPARAAADFIKQHTNSKVELRLLCGVTLEPVVIYEIIKPNEQVIKLATQGSKMMRRGLMVAASWNCAAGLGRMFGLPLPKVTEASSNAAHEAKAFLDELKEGSPDLDAAEAVADAGEGMDLEQMQAFAAYLEKLDEKRGEKWTAKLFRIEDPVSKGRLTWASSKEHGVYGGNDHMTDLSSSAEAEQAPSGTEPAPAPAHDGVAAHDTEPNRKVCCAIL